ncbi:hypothetical protein SMACR_07009 [Sordaria macrospora]|uniref:NB-ARC domain-containing protein n=1 Tax=Sordaria macrospora TaxID=5147 RepID=A0A8S8ZT24_SORMA|nr:hypothetical protein SMACR_07009 [Sordaria macrospora]WPJ67170.1 hypothetical protein SMAC4_07009 [Sordaria macrospora]
MSTTRSNPPAQSGVSVRLKPQDGDQRKLPSLPHDHLLSMQARWKDAVSRWESRLDHSNYEKNPHNKAIAEFKSYEDLLVDLEKRLRDHQDSSSETTTHSLHRLRPVMNTVNQLSPWLLTATAIKEVTSKHVTLVWALLYLGVNSLLSFSGKSPKEDKNLRHNLLKEVESLRREMEKFDEISQNLVKFSNTEGSNQQIAAAIVDMFESFINFWVQGVVELDNWRGEGKHKYMRPFLQDPWPKIKPKAEEAMQDVRKAVERVNDLWDKQLKQISSSGLSMSAPGAQTQSVDRVQSCIILPDRRSLFHGRVEDLEAIESHLINPEDQRLGRAFSIYGLAGVGKTATALEFGHRCAAKKLFDVILWVRAEKDTSCAKSFTEIAQALELGSEGASADQDAQIVVKNWLRKTKKSWLLIYDNVEDFSISKDYLPPTPTSGSVLMTTRYSHVASKASGMQNSRELHTFNPEDSLDIFTAFRKEYHQKHSPVPPLTPDEKEDAEFIIRELGGLVLAIEIIAAYIESNAFTIAGFRKKYSRTRAAIHKKKVGINRVDSDRSIEDIWQMTIDSIKGTKAHHLLEIVSMLSPDHIPLELFWSDELREHIKQLEEGFEHFDHPLFPSNGAEDFGEEILDEAADQLKGLALIRRTGNTISIHRLLQSSIYSNIPIKERQPVFDGAAKLVNFVFPKQKDIEPLGDRWPQCRKYIEHAQTLAALFTSAFEIAKSRLNPSPELQELTKNAAWYLYETGEHRSCYNMVEQAWEMCPDPQNSVIYAHLCNTAGVVHFDWNELSKSEEMHKKCLEIRSKLLPENDPTLSGSHFNLGQVYSALGKHKEAEDEFEIYRQIIERSGVPQETIMKGLANMVFGRALFLQGKLKEAKFKFDDSYKCFGGPEKKTSILLAYLMLCYGNMALANSVFAQAMENFEEGYTMAMEHAPTHALTAAFQYKLGFIQFHHRRFDHALEHCRAGLPIVEASKLRGDQARILYLMSECLHGKAKQAMDQGLSTAAELQKEAKSLAEKAKGIRDDLSSVKETDVIEACLGFKAYDSLVCLYQR